jgi:hypothetical protein
LGKPDVSGLEKYSFSGNRPAGWYSQTKDGRLDIQYRADAALINGLNVPGTFTGGIVNRENIGKTSEELYLEWNGTFRDNQVEISAN